MRSLSRTPLYSGIPFTSLLIPQTRDHVRGIPQLRDWRSVIIMKIPNDADGDAMRRVLNSGSDPSKSMDIDFMIACPSIESAELIAQEVEVKGYKPSISVDKNTEAITCYCMKSMLLDYDLLSSAQTELDVLARSYEGYIDGWGTFGNAPNPKS